MKVIIQFIAIGCMFIYAILISACKKDIFSGPSLASLTVTNAVVGGNAIRIGSNMTQVANNLGLQLTVIAGETELYVWPINDSTKPYYTNSKFNAEEQGVYSLFLAGQLSNVTGVLIRDVIPYHTDSTCGVRIINLVPNSTPLNITLSNTPGVNEVSNLAYLQYTPFKIYQAKAVNTNYIFQIRKASDNSILGSYNLAGPFPRFTNVTLVIRGLMGGLPAIGVTRVNNDR